MPEISDQSKATVNVPGKLRIKFCQRNGLLSGIDGVINFDFIRKAVSGIRNTVGVLRREGHAGYGENTPWITEQQNVMYRGKIMKFISQLLHIRGESLSWQLGLSGTDEIFGNAGTGVFDVWINSTFNGNKTVQCSIGSWVLLKTWTLFDYSMYTTPVSMFLHLVVIGIAAICTYTRSMTRRWNYVLAIITGS